MSKKKKAKIYRAYGDPAFSGVRYGVTFTKGVGETDDVRVAQRLVELGYRVEQAYAEDEGEKSDAW